MQARYDSAYVHTLTVLKGLFDPALANGSLPDMAPAERSTALKTLLQVCFDPFFCHASQAASMLCPSEDLLPILHELCSMPDVSPCQSLTVCILGVEASPQYGSSCLHLGYCIPLS